MSRNIILLLQAFNPKVLRVNLIRQSAASACCADASNFRSEKLDCLTGLIVWLGTGAVRLCGTLRILCALCGFRSFFYRKIREDRARERKGNRRNLANYTSTFV
jgi:hypothetical protein